MIGGAEKTHQRVYVNVQTCHEPAVSERVQLVHRLLRSVFSLQRYPVTRTLHVLAGTLFVFGCCLAFVLHT